TTRRSLRHRSRDRASSSVGHNACLGFRVLRSGRRLTHHAFGLARNLDRWLAPPGTVTANGGTDSGAFIPLLWTRVPLSVSVDGPFGIFFRYEPPRTRDLSRFDFAISSPYPLHADRVFVREPGGIAPPFVVRLDM